jgi:hypothetical protein
MPPVAVGVDPLVPRREWTRQREIEPVHGASSTGDASGVRLIVITVAEDIGDDIEVRFIPLIDTVDSAQR